MGCAVPETTLMRDIFQLELLSMPELYPVSFQWVIPSFRFLSLSLQDSTLPPSRPVGAD